MTVPTRSAPPAGSSPADSVNSESPAAGSVPGTADAPRSFPRTVRHAAGKRWNKALGGPFGALIRSVLWFFAAVVVLIGGALVAHNVGTARRNAPVLVRNEIRDAVLRRGEVVRAEAAALQRHSYDYFRATRGQIVLTNQRLFFVGLMPREILSPEDQYLPRFARLQFNYDTLTRLTRGHAWIGFDPALVVESPSGTEKFAILRPDWPDAQKLWTIMRQRQESMRAAAKQTAELRATALKEARAPLYHDVKRGEAVFSVASRYLTTPEEIRALNNLPDDRIRIGQHLLVRKQRQFCDEVRRATPARPRAADSTAAPSDGRLTEAEYPDWCVRHPAEVRPAIEP